MKAEPPLPTTSARHVAQIGARAVAAAQTGTLPRQGRVLIALRLEAMDAGLTRLINAATGEAVGIYASAALAERSRNFFA